MSKLVNLIFILALAIFYFGERAWGQNDDGSAGTPDRPEVDRPEILPGDLLEEIQSYRAEKIEMRSDLRDVLAELDQPTKDEVREAIAGFREANADRIELQHILAASIRDQLHDIRGVRDDRPEPGSLSSELANRIQDFKDERDALIQQRHAFMDSIRDLSDEEKEAAIQAFRSDLRQELEVQKELRRRIREDVEGEVSGARRNEG